MKKEILSQEEFNRRIDLQFSFFKDCNSSLILKNSHTAALERIAELRNELRAAEKEVELLKTRLRATGGYNAI